MGVSDCKPVKQGFNRFLGDFFTGTAKLKKKNHKLFLFDIIFKKILPRALLMARSPSRQSPAGLLLCSFTFKSRKE